MNDAQQILEFKELHLRCDKLTQAVNTLTSATSSHILTIRAYENIINGSWILTRWFAQWKIEAEKVKINDLEAELRNIEMRQQERALREVEEQIKTKAAEKDRATLTGKREKQFKKMVRKGEAE